MSESIENSEAMAKKPKACEALIQRLIETRDRLHKTNQILAETILRSIGPPEEIIDRSTTIIEHKEPPGLPWKDKVPFFAKAHRYISQINEIINIMNDGIYRLNDEF